MDARTRRQGCLIIGVAAVAATISPAVADTAAWQALTLDIVGPPAQELGGKENPFLDYRLDVTFTGPQGQTYVVPGFYDGNGQGGGVGNVWRTRFTPDQAGQWSYAVSFRQGAGVAVADPGSLGGFATTGPHGQTGTLNVTPRDPNAPGFLSRGRLAYTGGHYLQTLGDGRHWIKTGTDSPENLLGYSGFDNTPHARHDYAPHRNDWNPGDPDWSRDAAYSGQSGVGDGRNLVGAINYLAGQGVNSVYFLPMNIGGDGQDTWPYASESITRSGDSSNDNLRFDVSKLAQWETVFEHAQRNGIHLHVVLNEAELANKAELDSAALGIERRLFYREMVARFGHHNALQWNISEEYNREPGEDSELAPSTVKSFAQAIADLDPYDHPITVHNGNIGGWPDDTRFPGEHPEIEFEGETLSGQRAEWEPFVGDPLFSVTSIQNYDEEDIGQEVEYFRRRTAAAGRPLPVMIDEPESIDSSFGADGVRQMMLWDILLSGGGVEWFVRGEDDTLEDFREFEDVWRQSGHARRFLEENTPFWRMQPVDALLTGEDGHDLTGENDAGEVFAALGEVYAIYLPDTDDNLTGLLDLSDYTGPFAFRWFDPASGQFVGGAILLEGGSLVDLPDTPGLNASGDSDWVALIVSNNIPEPSAAAGLATLLAMRRPRRP